MTRVTVVGGGVAGLVAATAAAEAGATVTVYEAHAALGGRARNTDPPYIANLGPHVFYCDGPHWSWLRERGLVSDAARLPLISAARIRMRHGGRLHLSPPMRMARTLARRRLVAPVDQEFSVWAAAVAGHDTARALANFAAVVTFDHDPGRLSAAFVWERLLRVTALPVGVRYIRGGWGTLIERLAAHAAKLGVRVETAARVDTLPDPPVIVATDLAAARLLLADDALRWESGTTALLDVAVRRSRRDLFIVSDLDAPGWLERYTAPDDALAPSGESLVQVQVPMRPGETKAHATIRAEALVDDALPSWRDRLTWRRDSVARCRSGALDLPGRTWRDRPRIDRGDGVYLCGDAVAAPGMLSEVSINSAVSAVELACRVPAVTRTGRCASGER